MNHVRTIDKTEPLTPEARLRREWGQSLRESMREWTDPANPIEMEGMTVKRLQHELEQRFQLKVSEQAIYSWLAGDYSPRPRHQAAVAAVLGVKVRHLFPPLEEVA